MVRSKSERDKKVRRGCLIFVVLGLVIAFLLIAASLGWLGPIDRKLSGLPVIGGS
jgi:hypothetical protein